MAPNPFETLGLPPTATVDEVKARWKALASQHHPDRGGDAEVFNTMRQAYNEALKKASKPKKCQGCNGTGKQSVKEAWSFHSIEMRCKACKGRGEV
jgi:DnaJ-class molecular chaperone